MNSKDRELVASLEQRIAAARQVYDHHIWQVVQELREKLIVPYCKLRGLEFFAGNGTWFFTRDGEIYSPTGANATKFHELCGVLDEVPEGERQPIGSLCEPVRSEK